MRVPVALPFCLRAAVAFAPSTRREVAVRLHANDDARDDGPVQIQLDAVAGENASDDELDWDAEFANLQRSRQGSSDSAASALAPPPPPLPVPRIRAPVGAPPRAARHFRDVARSSTAEMSARTACRDGPVNPDARQRGRDADRIFLADGFGASSRSRSPRQPSSFSPSARSVESPTVPPLLGVRNGAR